MFSFEEYKQHVKQLPFGKRVVHNVYILWPDLKEVSPTLTATLEGIHNTSDTTLIKFFLDQFKLSFLEYPEFFSDPHPSLHSSTTIDLSTGKKRTLDYTNHSNPPILHRKETMISPNRIEYNEWVKLTKKLEEYDCYAQPRKIGFKNFWDNVLEQNGLSYQGHSLLKSDTKSQTETKQKNKTIDRHKTAMARTDFSRPLQFIIKHNLLSKTDTYLDYGCGLGDDVRALHANGYEVNGWDPVHAPDGTKIKSDVVNLGFVLNVIEDPAERIDTLHLAFGYVNRMLSVAVVTDSSPTATNLRPYRDGFLTSRDTFQKYFKHDEAQELIEETLHISAHSVAPGIFFIFKDDKDAQDFLLSRHSRSVNWNMLNLHIYPSKDERDAAKKELLYQQNKEYIERYWTRLLELGRTPTSAEFIYETLNKLTTRKLEEWFIQRHGNEPLALAFNRRREDLLVFLALSNFKKKLSYNSLSGRLQKDMKAFFGSYKAAQQEALKELFKIGNPAEITERSNSIHKNKKIGKLDDHALFINAEELYELDPVLRIYVGVAGLLYGDLSEADEIKIHKQSGKVTLLIRKSPDLKPGEYFRVKINLRNQKVDFYQHKNLK